jgi:hypothetical protein
MWLGGVRYWQSMNVAELWLPVSGFLRAVHLVRRAGKNDTIACLERRHVKFQRIDTIAP